MTRLMHQMAMGFQAQTPNQPGQLMAIKFLMHLYDFNSNLKVTAPANAIPATSPFLPTATPTRKK